MGQTCFSVLTRIAQASGNASNGYHQGMVKGVVVMLTAALHQFGLQQVQRQNIWRAYIDRAL